MQSEGDIADDGGEKVARGDGPGGNSENEQGQADVEKGQHAHFRPRRSARPINCAVEAPDSSTSAQMTMSLKRVEQACRAGQQPEDDEAEAQIVRLRQGMQPGQRIGKAQQPDGSGEKEEHACADRDEAEEIAECGQFSVSPSSESSRLTKAMVAKAASKARPSATSLTPGTRVA